MTDYIELLPEDLYWVVRGLGKNLQEALKCAYTAERYGGPTVRPILAGGCIRSRISGERPNDIDLIVASASMADDVARNIEPNTARHHRTQNAITLPKQPITVQVIHRWTYTDPLVCMEEFDFTIAKAAVWWDGICWRSAAHPRFYPDLAAKRLTYTAPDRAEDAGGSMLRVLKFYQRGFRIPLDDLGKVIARLMQGVGKRRWEGGEFDPNTESGLGGVLSGLLREVDPSIDPDHIMHLPCQADILAALEPKTL